MTVRASYFVPFLLVLLSTPALGVSNIAGAGDGGNAAARLASTPGLPSGQTGTAQAAAPLTPCSETLRSFRARNTLKPSLRRQAISRCEQESVDGWASHTPAH